MVMTRRGRLLVAGLAALLAVAPAACASAGPGGPAEVAPAAVALPGGDEPQLVAAAGDTLLVGVRHPGRPTEPGVLRRGPDGTVTAVPTRAATPYGRTASWYALTGDGTQVLGVGGDRGGAHGNVRWSVWTGSADGVAEHGQAFSTFGGWGAGDLVGAVLAPTGPVLAGSWQSDGAGLDVAVWTADGDAWLRRGSTGTALASTRATQGFATSAARGAGGVLITGWQVGGAGHPGPAPVVWSSADPRTGRWTRTVLPDAGAAGTAAAAACDPSGCAVSGRVDGVLALWRLAGGRWARVGDLPPVAVGDTDPLPAPMMMAGRLVQVVPDGGALALLDVAGGRVARAVLTGTTGPATAAAAVGSTVYVVAGRPARLWRLDLPSRTP